MAILFLFAAVLGCALARPSTEKVTPVEVTVYYETLCPGCRSFIPGQLVPTYTDTSYDFASLISKLTLVPYGWVFVQNASAHEYICQHGESECEGNKLQACAIEYISDEKTTLNYIACLESEALSAFKLGLTGYPIDKCQDKLPAGAYTKILNCYKSDEAWTLFEKNGVKTNSFFTKSGFVPYVSFNDKRDDDLASSALRDFKKTLCKLAGATDKACSS